MEAFGISSPSEPKISVCDNINSVSINLSDTEDSRRSPFEVETAGVVQDIDVIDTTGAGDAFIGGYLLCRLVFPNDSHLALLFGTWVAGKKLEGPGAQSALPNGPDIDKMLGKNIKEVQRSLDRLIGPFG